MTLTIKDGKIVNGFDAFCAQVNDIYMRMMIQALAKVSPKYIAYGNSFHMERTFQCEFYHQWSLLLEKNPDNLCLNGEVIKYIDGKLKFPDIILHHSQDDNKNNKIACEIKRCKWGRTGVKKDMKTLNLMLTGAAPNTNLTQNYDWGVFIQVGGTINRLKEFVCQSSFNENIFCIVVDDNVTQLTVKKISDMKD